MKITTYVLCVAIVTVALLRSEHVCEQHGQELACIPAHAEQQHVVERTALDARPIATRITAVSSHQVNEIPIGVRSNLAMDHPQMKRPIAQVDTYPNLVLTLSAATHS